MRSSLSVFSYDAIWSGQEKKFRIAHPTIAGVCKWDTSVQWRTGLNVCVKALMSLRHSTRLFVRARETSEDCSILHIFGHNYTLVEILSKTDNPKANALETEFYALRLVDLGLNLRPRFLIREIHAAWSDSEQRSKWDVYCDGLCSIPEEAQQHFATRKAAIIARGFNCSNQPADNFSRGFVR